MKEKLKHIKETISKTAEKFGVKVEMILLFGSRARGDYKEDSDWDILIVTRDKLDAEKKLNFWYEIYRNLDLPSDIIIVSKEAFEKHKKSRGFVYRYALQEGIVV